MNHSCSRSLGSISIGGAIWRCQIAGVTPHCRTRATVVRVPEAVVTEAEAGVAGFSKNTRPFCVKTYGRTSRPRAGAEGPLNWTLPGRAGRMCGTCGPLFPSAPPSELYCNLIYLVNVRLCTCVPYSVLCHCRRGNHLHQSNRVLPSPTSQGVLYFRRHHHFVW